MLALPKCSQNGVHGPLVRVASTFAENSNIKRDDQLTHVKLKRNWLTNVTMNSLTAHNNQIIIIFTLNEHKNSITWYNLSKTTKLWNWIPVWPTVAWHVDGHTFIASWCAPRGLISISVFQWCVFSCSSKREQSCHSTTGWNKWGKVFPNVTCRWKG